MPLSQLIYTKPDVVTSVEHPSTFVLMVDSEMYEKHKKDKSIPLASIVDSFDILKYDNGKSGKIVRPSKAEIQDTFGTTRDDDVVEFMLEHGQHHGKIHASNGEPGARTRAGKYASGIAY